MNIFDSYNKKLDYLIKDLINNHLMFAFLFLLILFFEILYYIFVIIFLLFNFQSIITLGWNHITSLFWFLLFIIISNFLIVISIRLSK